MAEKCLYADHHTTSHDCRIFLLYIFGLIIKSIYDKRYFPLSILPPPYSAILHNVGSCKILHFIISSIKLSTSF